MVMVSLSYFFHEPECPLSPNHLPNDLRERLDSKTFRCLKYLHASRRRVPKREYQATAFHPPILRGKSPENSGDPLDLQARRICHWCIRSEERRVGKECRSR